MIINENDKLYIPQVYNMRKWGDEWAILHCLIRKLDIEILGVQGVLELIKEDFPDLRKQDDSKPLKIKLVELNINENKCFVIGNYDVDEK